MVRMRQFYFSTTLVTPDALARNVMFSEGKCARADGATESASLRRPSATAPQHVVMGQSATSAILFDQLVGPQRTKPHVDAYRFGRFEVDASSVPISSAAYNQRGRKEVHDLRKQGLAEVHGDSGVATPGTLVQTAISDSSRRRPLSPEKPRRHWLPDQYLSS